MNKDYRVLPACGGRSVADRDHRHGRSEPGVVGRAAAVTAAAGHARPSEGGDRPRSREREAGRPVAETCSGRCDHAVFRPWDAGRALYYPVVKCSRALRAPAWKTAPNAASVASTCGKLGSQLPAIDLVYRG